MSELSTVSLQNVSGQALQSAVNSSDDTVLCLMPTENEPDGETLSAAVKSFEDSSAKIGLLPVRTGGDLAFIWNRLPAAVASFVMPPDERAAVLVKPSGITIELTADGERPAQQMLVQQAIREPHSVVLLDQAADLTQSALPASGLALPDLAPDHPGRSARWLADELSRFEPRRYLPDSVDATGATAMLAGLWQINDYLDESHTLSQSIQGKGPYADGDYWHAIMHRREPDYGNSKYWFGRVGTHPCFANLSPLAEAALAECRSDAASDWQSRLTSGGEWNSAAFVDCCRSAASGNDEDLTHAAKRIQWSEMLLLLSAAT